MNDLMRTCKNISLNNCSEYLIPLLIGFVFFGYVFNYDILDPENISWLTDDRFQSYIGWEFYRHTPWSFPIIGKTDYGIELSSSVVFTDSNPWLSIFFKIISPWLPDTFQFSGVWLLLCVILQSIVLWKIISLYTSELSIKILATMLMLFNPAWMARYGHLTLMAFFIFSSAIYLSLRFIKKDEMNNNKWLLLLCLGIGIHFYIFFIIFMNWFFVLIFALYCKKNTKREFIKYFILNVIVSSCMFYILGYLTVGSGSTVDGYGYFKANLLYPIIAGDYSKFIGLSFFHAGEYEGFNYLGLGFIILIFLNIILGKINPQQKTKKYLPLIIFSTVCFLLAISNIVAIGDKEFIIPIPDFILRICGNFRASGRFIWPVTIILYIYLIVLSTKLNGKWPKIILTVSLFIQIYDTSAGWQKSHEIMAKKSFAHSEFAEYKPLWENKISQYKTVRWFPTENSGSKWAIISYYTNLYKQKTDGVYFARVDNDKLFSLKERVLSELISGRYDYDTVYLMDKDYSEYFLLRDGDSVFKFKDIYVLMPHPKKCVSCYSKVNEVNKDENIDFSLNGIGNILLGKGWYSPESWGVWSQGAYSELILPDTSKTLRIAYEAFLAKDQHENVNVDFYCGQQFLIRTNIGFNSNRNIELSLEQCNKDNSGTFKINMIVDSPVHPKDVLEHNNDSRLIGIGLRNITISY
ncbi:MULTISPECIES: DUF6311 domain-containing protein [Citrobacter]|uniref:Uncharacterized protein n=1 Tax=Citrobacter braakii TaxID=57706 RepID=A0A2Z4BXQ9_CITBR|nr:MULTISPECIES: DUF6311 domain-containing protein [Citrobacter]MDU5155038.1 DUF6311 domain-containing protein [Citrobacter sp.]TKV31811.1 hypothetical protein FDX20_17985 [Citrobacter sp. TBCS-11]AWU66617.1 hypothetical protein [Citrobacter braakii]MCK2152980.1 DUF6311 domain-containing protein [Citrobacter braakii]TKU22442.1 hypothetical protein FDW87_06245 [Citrobacter sp. wls826]